MKTDPKVHIGKWLEKPAKLKFLDLEALEIEGVDHIEIYCGNARQSAFFYNQTLGLKPIGYRGPETGFREAASYVLRHNEVTFVLTSPLNITNAIAGNLMVHGDTVHSVAFKVRDCEAFFYETMKRGAVCAEPPTMWEDQNGLVKRAKIKIYGDTVHSIIERDEYKGVYWPGFTDYTRIFPPPAEQGKANLQRIDHIVGNVELGQMERWVSFYETVLGFKQMQHFSDDQISTEYSALMSKVMRNGTAKIKLPINEPATGKRKSQIEEYLIFHNGPGVQHIALATDDIISTVSEMRARGMAFLRVPKTYYEDVPDRVGSIKEDLAKLAELGILIDRDDDGYLLQIFTKPVQDRPTLFFEVIQREGSNGFGVGNFKALFEAIEKEQALRGNL